MQLKYLIGIFCILSIVGCTRIIHLNSTNWYFKEFTKNNTPFSTFMKANIPSTVHLDLMDNDVVPDPYFRDNLLQFYALEKKDWIYKTNIDEKSLLKQFKMNEFTEIQLVFEGLDTHADVFINGKLILQANNMFRTWIIHNFEQLIEENGNNLLEIVFKSSVVHDLQKEAESPIKLPANYTYSRKAAYQYGWDWGPRLVTCGIWKDAYFKFVRKAEIVNTHFRTIKLDNVDISTGKGDALIKVDVELSSNIPNKHEVVLTIQRDDHIIYQQNHTLKHQNSTISTKFMMKQANLWWCQGMGKPNLYEYEVILKEKPTSSDQSNFEFESVHYRHLRSHKGHLLSQKHYRTGIRQIKVDQRADKVGNGTAFSFYLNGYYLFAKGGNYIPPDMFMPRALKNPEVYHKTIQDAVSANHNMIRLWGGGQFEYDIFYDLCDENGLLIWHDLMFACAMYPGEKDILFNIKQEMIDNVKRLRNHPSIGLWNGNNEVKIGWDSWGWQDDLTPEQRVTVWGWYLDIFNVTLRDVFDQEDPDVYYWPTSPSSYVNYVYETNTGDIHFWNVWGSGAPVDLYDQFVGRFNSEYGMQGALAYESVKKFTIEEDRKVNTTVMEIHERHIKGWPLISIYLNQNYLEPTDFKDYLYVSQLMQAYAIERAIFALRRNKPYCSGSLYCQLKNILQLDRQINDVWPVVSWASVDFYGNWKALHFRQKHLYQNIIVAIERNGTNYNQVNPNVNSTDNIFNVRVINDLHKKVKGKLSISMIDNKGKELKSFFDDVVKVPQDNLTEYSSTLNTIALKLNFQSRRTNWEFVHYFVIPKEFPYTDGIITIEREGADSVSVSSNTLVRDFYLYCDDDSEIKQISNNFFDILPNQNYSISFPKHNGCKKFAVKSLNGIMLNKSLQVIDKTTKMNNFKKHDH